jgi:prepilin-type processing-associated H-X9-DG protein
MLNPDLWGYKSGGCPGGGITGGYSHPGPNLISGTNGGDGLNGIGPASMTWTSVSKVILLIDLPTDGSDWFGASAAVWGSNFGGEHSGQTNAVYFDGHAKGIPTKSLTPNGTHTNDSLWKCANCNNAAYDGNQGGVLWTFWGTSYADSAHQ